MSQKRPRSKVNDTQRANNITIAPRTDNQRAFQTSLRNNDQTFALGPAGTGKTFLATVHACQLLLRNEIGKIVISRPAVAAQGEEYGFLPGGINQKLAPWMVPIVEIIEECIGKQQYLDLQKDGTIEIVPFGFMRGRTFKDCFVLVDEAQNTTAEQMEMLVTRMGEGSRLVVSGDIRQSDIKGRSGLTVAVDLIRKHKLPCGLIEFTSQDVVRSDLCKMWVQAFEERGDL